MTARTPKLTAEQLRPFAQALADHMNEQHPHLHFTVHDETKGTPPGAVTVPLVFSSDTDDDSEP